MNMINNVLTMCRPQQLGEVYASPTMAQRDAVLTIDSDEKKIDEKDEKIVGMYP